MTRFAFTSLALVTLFTLGALAALPGCNAVAGIHDPVVNATDSGTGDPGTGPVSAAVQPFLGTWTPGFSRQMITCGSNPEQDTTDPSVPLVVTADPLDPNGIVFAPGTETCGLHATVEGTVATVAANQSCAVNGVGANAGETFTYDYQAPRTTFTINEGAATADGVFDALVTAQRNGQFVATCSYVETTTYDKTQ